MGKGGGGLKLEGEGVVWRYGQMEGGSGQPGGRSERRHIWSSNQHGVYQYHDEKYGG